VTKNRSGTRSRSVPRIVTHVDDFSQELYSANLLRSLHNVMVNQRALHWDDLVSMGTIIDQVSLRSSSLRCVSLSDVVDIGCERLENSSFALIVSDDDSPFDSQSWIQILNENHSNTGHSMSAGLLQQVIVNVTATLVHEGVI
jgi:hypothetical protein